MLGVADFDVSGFDFATGDKHVCAAVYDGSALYCWGDNQYGQIGNNAAPTDVSQPLQVTIGVPAQWLGVAAGAGHSCGRIQSSSPTVYCWGRNTRGQLGDGSTADRPAPTRIVH